MKDTNYTRLYRLRKERVIGGVCSGLGVYLSIDPIIIRVLWLASIFVGGAGLLAYIIAWMLIPEISDGNEPKPVTHHETNKNATRIIGITLIVFAFVLLGLQFHLFPVIPWGWVWPMALVALGAALLLRPRILNRAESSFEETVYSTPGTESPADDEDSHDDSSSDEEDEKEGDTESSTTDEESGDADKSEFKTKYSSMRSEERTIPEDDIPRLRRSRTDYIIFGVCGGLAQRYKVDAVLIRVLWSVLTIFSAGFFCVAYLILALLLPKEV